VAVVVPTYNEAANLPLLARRLFALDIPGIMMIVVDDGSPDGTGQVAHKLAQEHGGRVEVVQRGRKLGLGTAYVEGFSRALAQGAEYVLQMDADLSHAPEYLPAFLRQLGQADVVVGSRYVKGGGVDQTWGFLRRLLSSGGNLGIRAITGLKVRDATSGFKAFRAGALRSMDIDRFQCKGFAFQAEVAHACQHLGHRVVEHPIIFASRVEGRSKMSVGIVVEAIWRLLPLRWSKDR
jgi:dolichol-phosphate mannosyltransferase